MVFQPFLRIALCTAISYTCLSMAYVVKARLQHRFNPDFSRKHYGQNYTYWLDSALIGCFEVGTPRELLLAQILLLVAVYSL